MKAWTKVSWKRSGFYRESVAVDEMRRQDENLAQTSRDECHCTLPFIGVGEPNMDARVGRWSAALMQ
jgi:hypothetical protein